MICVKIYKLSIHFSSYCPCKNFVFRLKIRERLQHYVKTQNPKPFVKYNVLENK